VNVQDVRLLLVTRQHKSGSRAPCGKTVWLGGHLAKHTDSIHTTVVLGSGSPTSQAVPRLLSLS